MHMQSPTVSRRTLLRGGSAALAGLSVWQVSGPAEAFPGHGDDDDGEDVPWSDHPSDEYPGSATDEVLKWLDQPPPIPPPVVDGVGTLLVWEDPHSRITPTREFFTSQALQPAGIDPSDVPIERRLAWLTIPLTLSLDDIKARPRREVEFTLECSGNTGTGLAFFIGGVGNARWAGARLAPVLREARCTERGHRGRLLGRRQRHGDDSRQLGRRGTAATTGTFPTDANGGLTITEQFARQHVARRRDGSRNLLCYEMNGEPLPPRARVPRAFDRPGLVRRGQRQMADAHRGDGPRYAGRFMARDYVTSASEQRDGQTALDVHHRRPRPAQVGAGQGHAPRRAVHRSSGLLGARRSRRRGFDRRRSLDRRRSSRVAAHKRNRGLRLEVLDARLGNARRRRTHVTSRAIDTDGNVQPAPDDPLIATKHTYWESNGQITRYIVIP